MTDVTMATGALTAPSAALSSVHPDETASAHGACTAGVRRAFDFLGKRWNGVILGTLDPGPAGFSELRRQVGSITDSVLSDRLAKLTQAGLIERTVTDTRPPGVQYRLTPAGRSLMPILDALGGWAHQHLPEETCRQVC